MFFDLKRKLSAFLLGLFLVSVTLGLSLWIFAPQRDALRLDSANGGPNWVSPTSFLLYVVLLPQVGSITSPVSQNASDASPVAFTVAMGQSAISVGQSLQAEGLIDNARTFQLLLRYNGLDTSIEAGDYVLQRNMSMKDIALALQKAPTREIIVTIPEGWRLEQIAAHLTEANIMDGQAFLTAAQAGTVVSHPVLADRPLGASYEGYLFPDTYRLPLNATPADLIERMLNNLARQLPDNTPELLAERGYTLYQVLTLASIVERESVLAEERGVIASVFWNRLGSNVTNGYLEADPTVQYAIGYHAESGQWWKRPLTFAELEGVDSPYNTYRYPGLPPGPIANPGQGAILAALNPVESPYYYFVCARPGCERGAHVFAETYEEHLENAKRYWGE